mgnify:CR=1 FL=1
MSANLLLVGLGGFAASLVDGALGMGFGPTASSILLSSGLPAKAASATVNIAKVATGLVAGGAHWRFGNIDRKVVARLAVPGAIGAIVGTTVLKNVDDATIRPVLAGLLVLVGLRILWRFGRSTPAQFRVETANPDLRGLEVAAVAGGVTNGMIGAWGPVVTPFLLHRKLAPRLTVGSVNTAEVAVAAVAATSLGRGGLDMKVVIAMLVGGALAAPVAAWAIRHLPARGMGVTVSGLLLLTSAQTLAGRLDLGVSRWIAYVAIVAAVAVAGLWPRLRHRHTHETAPSVGQPGLGVGDEGGDLGGQSPAGEVGKGDVLKH